MRPKKIRIGDILVQQNVISPAQLDQALLQQQSNGRKLGRILIENNVISERRLSELLSQQLNLPFIELKHFNVNPEIVNQLPEAQARRFRALILEDRGTSLLVGLSDPTDLYAYDELSRLLGREISLAIVNESSLLEVIDRIYRRTDEINGLARELETEMGNNAIDFQTFGSELGSEDAPVVKLLRSLFEDAVQINASDIHLEPQESSLQIRFRIDGLMHLQSAASFKIASAVTSRLKLMAGLDISEKRLPQDGRFTINVKNTKLDIRMSSMPTQYGESIVLRLLKQNNGILGLDNLGMPTEMLSKFRKLVNRSSGMVLVTGPTGSGKTTTLYAALSELNAIDTKIITVEDPVEYRLEGINQVQVNNKINLDFARVLRTTLRQDPDIILVGEMRDQETAEIGMRAAITGHMVLSTLHTRNAATTPVRLIDMGVPSFMVASSLQLVLAQRLVRMVCDNCAEPYQTNPVETEWLSNICQDNDIPLAFVHGRGCAHCNMTGYRNRCGVYEMLEMTPPLIEAASRNDPANFALQAERQMVGSTLKDHALKVAAAGKTSIQEVIRVTSQMVD